MDGIQSYPDVKFKVLGEPCTEAELRCGICYRLMSPEHKAPSRFYACDLCHEWFEEFAGGEVRYSQAQKRGSRCKSCLRDHPFTNDEEGPIKNSKPAAVEIQVPPLYLTASINDVAPKFRKVVDSWPRERKFLAIIGNPGAGKTHICWAVAKKLALAGQKTTLLWAPEMKDRWMAALHSYEAESLVRGWEYTPLLLVDDLSAPTASEGWTALLHEVLDRRLTWQKPTLLTMTTPDADIEKRFGASIRSRLHFFDFVTLLSATGKAMDWRKIRR